MTTPPTNETGFRLIPLEQIREPERAMRANLDTPSLHSLAKSIEGVGLLHPIVVCNRGLYYEVIVGHRRFLAHKILKRTEIMAQIIPAAGGKELFARYEENISRKDVSPIDEGEYLQAIMTEFGMNARTLAKRLNRSSAYISERLAVNAYCPELKAALQTGQISFSVAREFHKFPTDVDRLEYLRHAISNGCTPTQARYWRKAVENQIEYAATQPELEISDEPPPPMPDMTPHRTCYLCRREFEIHKCIPVTVCTECAAEFERELRAEAGA